MACCIAIAVGSGHIPDELARLSRLERLCLRDNWIMGQCGLPLRTLLKHALTQRTHACMHAGDIPSSFSNLTRLRSLCLKESAQSGKFCRVAAAAWDPAR